jgi:DNA-binding MarR family transcriptional regulator
MHELADHTLISRSAATRLIDKIEEAGLVERRVCPSDRRGMEVVLTTEGKKVQESAAPIVLRGLQRHFGRHLDLAQAETLATALESVLTGEGAAVSESRS